MRPSFTGSIVKSRSGDMYFITGRDGTGAKAYYYVQAHKGKKPLLERALASGSLRLSDFGEVIASGYGEVVPEDIKERMRRDYGCD